MQQHDEGAAGTGKVPALAGMSFFCASEPASARIGNDHQKAADQHGDAERRVVPRRVGGEAGEGAAVVAGAGAVGIEHFAQAMRAGVVRARPVPIC